MTHFTGTLHRTMNGAAHLSFLRQTDAGGNVSDTLLIRALGPGSTLGQQISAATAFFANQNEGDAIAVNGTIVPIGADSAIQF
jgi:hypothetical protein